jgi:hypothetical protein
VIPDERTERAVEFIRDNADLIGQLRGNKSYLEHRIKITRAQCFLESQGTVVERESLAWVNPEVEKLCIEYRDCVTELETLATKFKAAELQIEVWRTQQANSRRGHP